MKMQKNEKGITLVALVVTIVVLLILAGITIMYVMSDNGVFGQAKQAGKDTNTKAVEEAVSTALISLYPTVYTTDTTDLTTLFSGNLSSSMTCTSPKVTVTSGQIDTLTLGESKEAGITVTYKGKNYKVTYDPSDPTHLENGTAGVVAEPQ